jgi:predicted ATPase
LTKTDEELSALLNDLQLREFIYEQPAVRDTEFIFKHALTQEVAYNSVLIERRKQLHDRIGAAIETLFADRLEDRCGELARHYRLSRDARKAIHYLRLAGEQATSRCAPAQVSQHFRVALDALGALPEGQERDRLEFSLQVALGSAMTARSWGDTKKERALERARELGRRIGASGDLFPVLWHLAESYILIGKLDAARELAAQCLELAQGSGDPVLPVGAHHATGETRYWIGESLEARSHFSRAAEALRPSASAHSHLAVRHRSAFANRELLGDGGATVRCARPGR